MYSSVRMRQTYKIEHRYCWEYSVLDCLVEDVNVAILFKNHFTRKWEVFVVGLLLWCMWSTFNTFCRNVVLFS